jgi:hypothetical protein
MFRISFCFQLATILTPAEATNLGNSCRYFLVLNHSSNRYDKVTLTLSNCRSSWYKCKSCRQVLLHQLKFWRTPVFSNLSEHCKNFIFLHLHKLPYIALRAKLAGRAFPFGPQLSFDCNCFHCLFICFKISFYLINPHHFEVWGLKFDKFTPFSFLISYSLFLIYFMCEWINRLVISGSRMRFWLRQTSRLRSVPLLRRLTLMG